MKYKLLIALLFGLVAIIFFAFRFTNIENRLIFDWDQQNIATQAMRIVHEHRPVLLGPRATSDKGFFLGPYFNYFAAPFFAATDGHPSAYYPLVALVNIAFFLVASYVLTRTLSALHALFFLLFWGANWYLVTLDIVAWWAITLPLFTMMCWYLLCRLETNSRLFALLLGINLGLGINHHFQFIYVVMIALSTLVITRLMQHKRVRKADLIEYTYLLVGFGITFVPLVVFDLRNGFLNTQLFISFFTEGVANTTERGHFLWMQTLTNFFTPLLGTKSTPLSIAVYVAIIYMSIWLAVHERKVVIQKMFYGIFALLLCLLPIALTAYNKRPSEYYFLWFYPYIYIVGITFLIKTRMYMLLLFYAIYISLYGAQNLPMLLRSNDFSLFQKDQTALILKGRVLPNTRIGVGIGMPPGLDNGFRYMLSARGINHVDPAPDVPLVQINNPKRDGDVRVNEAIGITIPSEVAIPACFR